MLDTLKKIIMSYGKNDIHTYIQFPWLIIEGVSSEKKLFCSLCRGKKENLKLYSVWANDGYPNIQLSSIGRHNLSTEHQNHTTPLRKK